MNAYDKMLEKIIANPLAAYTIEIFCYTRNSGAGFKAFQNIKYY